MLVAGFRLSLSMLLRDAMGKSSEAGVPCETSILRLGRCRVRRCNGFTRRRLVEGAIYRYRTGIAWRDLPTEFGPWQTVWKRHHRFSTDRTWDKVLSALQVQADAMGQIDWRLSVDSTSARVHQHGETASRSVTGPTSHTGGTFE